MTPGSHYLVDIDFSGTHPGDLPDIGRWQRPEVTSLAGNSAAGMPMTLERHDWFPLALAFTAVADRVRLLLYSEAPRTDFLVPGLSVRELTLSTRPPVVHDPSH